MYSLETKPSCQESINKLSKKIPVLKKALENKVKEIILNPNHYKPLRNELAGERRVHLLKSFVLIFEINENNKTVILLFFGHHNQAYRK